MCESMVDIQSPTAEIRRGKKKKKKKQDETRMWANAQRDGRLSLTYGKLIMTMVVVTVQPVTH